MILVVAYVILVVSIHSYAAQHKKIYGQIEQSFALGDRWGRSRTTAAMMGISGSCAVLIGLLFGASAWLVLLVSLVWGFAIVADSAQFSTMVTELCDQAYVGTALTLQLAGASPSPCRRSGSYRS